MKRFGFGILAAAALLAGTACSDDDGDEGVPAELVYVSGQEQTGLAGAALPQPLVVEVLNAAGDGVEGIELRWETTGGATVSDASTNTGPDGRSSITVTLGPVPGGQTVQVVAPSLEIGDVVFTFTAGDPDDGGGGGGGELP
jgi:hypothetical protein